MTKTEKYRKTKLFRERTEQKSHSRNVYSAQDISCLGTAGMKQEKEGQKGVGSQTTSEARASVAIVSTQTFV